MTETKTCPKCGTKLPGDAPAGICPACLLQAGLATDQSAAAQPQLKSTTAPMGFVPPAAEELAKHFSGLEVLELLGAGGMGAVYKARQRSLDRLVAVKILPPEIGRDAAFAERFTREARALACLSHSQIVSVYDFGQVDGLFFIVMEYVDGVNLRQTIQSGKLTPREALAIVPQICEALQYAHDEGIVHRDIKPENILIDKKGRVKIADFGLAKLLGRAAPEHALTGTNQVMGTVRYMAPEQMEASRAVDHRADIYSLGVVFYEMLTGELPLGRFALPSEMVQVDVRLDEVVLRSLEKAPERRYQHASEVKTDLETISRSAHKDPPVPMNQFAPRIAFLSLLIFCAGWLLLSHDRLGETVRGPLVTTLIAFVLARAALGWAGAKPLTAGQKWLLYPSLLAVYMPLAAIALLGPGALAAGALIKSIDQFRSDRDNLQGDIAFYNNRISRYTEELRQAQMHIKETRPIAEIKKDLSEHIIGRDARTRELAEYPAEPTLRGVALTPVMTICGFMAVTGATWFLLGIFATLFPAVIRAVFCPFAANFSRRIGFAMTVLGLLMSLSGLVVFR